MDWYAGALPPVAAWVIGIAGMALSAVAAGVGLGFRRNIHHGRAAAVANLTPGLLTIAAVAVFLWYYAGRDIVSVSPTFAFALVTLALAVLLAATDAMKSRQHRAAIAFRKKLAAARAHFISELARDEPSLRDHWMPWILAFGLGKQIDDWSARQTAPTTDHARWSGSSSSSSESSSERWTGFGGGRSGGAGGGASWAAAAGGLAAGVAPPSSSGSSDGGGGGSSSSSGSSGGGGGGGW
jgi:uncharacterized membrane protein YgcG